MSERPATALIMAGGQGLRMSASGVGIPKPLVPILAVPVLERNLYALIRDGFNRIAIAIPHGVPALEEFVASRARSLADAAGVCLDVFVDHAALGNIGCAGRWSDAQALLVVYADNLTTLDLAGVLAAHVASAADLTLATHLQPFRMPFGEVHVEDGEVRGYTEKPVYRFPVASAVSVLGPRALAALPQDRPTGLSALAQGLIDDGGRVREYRHSAPWIDVNDAVAVGEAETLVARHQRDFDLWARPASGRLDLLLAVSGGSVLMVRSGHPPGRWSLPTCEALGTGGLDEPGIVFDDLDESGTGICRVQIRRVGPPLAAGIADANWRDLAGICTDPTVADHARRAVAISARQPNDPA